MGFHHLKVLRYVPKEFLLFNLFFHLVLFQLRCIAIVWFRLFIIISFIFVASKRLAQSSVLAFYVRGLLQVKSMPNNEFFFVFS